MLDSVKGKLTVGAVALTLLTADVCAAATRVVDDVPKTPEQAEVEKKKVEMVRRTVQGHIVRAMGGDMAAFYWEGRKPCMWIKDDGKLAPGDEIIPLPEELEGDAELGCKLVVMKKGKKKDEGKGEKGEEEK